jgi:hypothetical protein
LPSSFLVKNFQKAVESIKIMVGKIAKNKILKNNENQ